MSNIFGKVERSVQTVKCISKEYTDADRISESAATNIYLRNKATEEKKKLEETMNATKNEKTDETVCSVIQRSLDNNKIVPIMNKITTTAKETILKNILFEVFYNALILDESFKSEHREQLEVLIDVYVNNNGGFKILTEAIQKSDSLLLKKIKTLCESIATEVCKRKINESQNPDSNISVIDFDMDKNETEKLNYGKEVIDIDQISELVKNKVFTVIRDEKTKQENASNVIKNIEDDAAEIIKKEDETDDKKESTAESFERFIIQKPLVETSTLFNSLFRSTYRDFITENVAISSDVKHLNDEHKEMSRDYDTETDTEDVSSESPDEKDEIETSEINKDIMIDNQHTIDMDLVLAETITKYTLMETLYTLKIENYTVANMKKLTEQLLNPVVEGSNKENSKTDNKYVEYRARFFKNINNLKDLKFVNNAKDDINKLYDSMDKKDKKKYFDGFIKTAIAEFESAKDKNPKLAKSYDEFIDWLKAIK